ncbi:MAG TPA: MFS transporter [Acidimicrobiales bacterium]|jgi:MFS family permease|nr:MFS transporter [Acidimicrobiales bacterium]
MTRHQVDDRYKWVALANTTAATFMAVLDGSIVIIALPAIFRGIHLNPLAPGNITYLLWMIMGYRLVQAVFVVSLGRLGDMFGRVRIYNAGFAVFTFASVLLSIDPFLGSTAALWLIGWRFVQAIGGSMLMANSAAILTDAFPEDQRGFALGINQVAGMAGQFIGLVLGGVLAIWDWRAVFWVNVPVGIFGTLWAYYRLREVGTQSGGRMDWWGNITFAVGLGSLLVAITIGIQPYHGQTMGWTNPEVLALLFGGLALLAAFAVIETKVRDPMFNLALFRIRAFAAGNVASFAARLGQGGLQFMLVIWLQGIWLPLHGYAYSSTPLWAGIFLLPLTGGFLVAGPLCGFLSDRYGARGFSTAGMLVYGASFIGLMLLPVNFSYPMFATLIAINGIGIGMFSAPNTSSIMTSVPAEQRGAASGMRATFQNSGTALSIGVFFSLMITGLASTLPKTLTKGLEKQGVAHAVAHHVASLPPVSSLFASVLGINPLRQLLSMGGELGKLPAEAQRILTGKVYFPDLLSAPFHHGLTIVFLVSAGLAFIAAAASMARGPRATSDTSGPPAGEGRGEAHAEADLVGVVPGPER